MKMFKKLMAVVLTGALAVSMLTGCSIVDNLKKDNALKALGDVATAQLGKDSKVETIKFEEKSTLNTELKNLLKDAKAEDVEKYADGAVTTDKKYVVVAVEVKKSTSSVSEFKDYAANLLAGMSQEGYNIVSETSSNGKTVTVKVGVKVDSFKDADNHTNYYAIVLVPVTAAA